MLAQLSMWVLAAAVAQAAPENTWLRAIPADVDLVVRVRGMEAIRDDLLAMLRAMSPALAETAEPRIREPIEKFVQTYGDSLARVPLVTLMRTVDPAQVDAPPFAVLVISDDYEGLLKSISSGGEAKRTPQEGGYDALDNPKGGGAMYAVKGAGFVAFGPDKMLIAAVAQPEARGLDAVLTPSLRLAFLSGDAALYVNAARLATRYADQIDQARQALMNALDNAGQQMGNAASMAAAKQIYGSVFDSLKFADQLALSLDVAPEGAHIAGLLTVKADSDAAKAIAEADPGTATDLEKLSPDAALYVYTKLDAELIVRLQSMGIRAIAPEGKPTPEQQKAMDQLHGLGRIETLGAIQMDQGMRGLTVVTTRDPNAYMRANLTILHSMKEGEGPWSFFKDIETEENAQNDKGFTFSHTRVAIDLDKVAKFPGNNLAAADSTKRMFGGNTIDYWIGTDGQRVVQITTPEWEDARRQLDQFLDGEAGVGKIAAFQTVRSKMPEKVNLIAMLSMQGLARMVANQFAATFNKPDLKVPGDMPKATALAGASLTPISPDSYEFHLVVPSTVGPVIEKGLIPLFQSIRGAN